MSSNFVKIPPSFERRKEPVEERVVSSDSRTIYLVDMDKGKIVPQEERIVRSFVDRIGNSVWGTADGVSHYKIKSSGEIGVLGKINFFDFQEKLMLDYDYNIENFINNNVL